jgi:hypothetical protein
MAMKKLTAVITLFIVFTAECVFGQGGKISGRITETGTGQPIPGANVLIEGTNTGSAANLEGEYFILNVPPGTYSIKASSIGYQSVIKTEVSVSLNHTTNLDFQLNETIIELKESVIILAERPLVERDQTSTRHFVNAEEIATRPTTELLNILQTLPGIDTDPGGELTVRRGSLDQVAFLIDGMRASNPLDYEPYTNVNLSSIQELEIITGGFNAEYGQAQSGVFNIVTKEGGRDLQLFSEFRYIPSRVPHWGTPFYDYSSTRYWENTHARHQQWWIDNPDQWVDNNGIPGNDPASSMTPEQAYDHYIRTHQPLTDYTSRSGYIGELAIGGPLPVNDLFFFITGKYRSTPPVTGNSFRKEGNWLDGTLKLTYNLSQSIKLMSSAFYGKVNSNLGMEYLNMDFLNSYGIESKYAYYDFAGYPDNNSNGITAQMTHVLNPSTFYQLQVSRIYRFRSQSTFPGDEDGWELGVPETDNLRATDEFGGAIPGGNNNLVGLYTSGYYYRGTDRNYEYTVSGDLVSQINTKWQIKTGGEFTYYHFDRFQEAKAFNALEQNVYNPYESNIYFQNKLEFEGLIINAGLRYDLYNANDVVYDVFDPLGTVSGEEPDPTDTKTFGQLSPRLGVSHPISENTVLHFSYGHFFQRANFGDYGEGYAVLGLLNTFLIDPGNGELIPYNIGNRNLKPRKTVEFELGIEHNFGGIVADVTAYYKDATNTVRTITVVNRGLRYSTSGNGDYGDSRGVEISLRRPLSGIWGGYLNYTFSGGIAGRSGTPVVLTAPGIPQQVGDRISIGDAVVHDRPRMKFGFTLLVPNDFTFLFSLFSNMQFAIDYQIYYPNANIASDVFSEGGKQFERTADKNANLRLRKEFQFGNIRPAFFIEVQNVFNDTFSNIDIVKSASPEDRARFINSRFSVYPSTKTNGAPFPDQIRYRNLPRQVMFGVAISL